MKKNIISIAFAIVFCAQTGLYAADIIAAPNPWVPGGGKVKTGTLAGGINFINLPADGELSIYTLTGSLVTKQELTSGAGAFNWNGKNDNGVNVASGVYFWVVRSAEATKSGKLIVVR